MASEQEIQKHIPLSDSKFYILGSLFRGPNHGYGLMKDILDLSQGEVKIDLGAMYVNLRGMRQDGLISRLDRGQFSPRQKRYGITELGKEVFNADLDRLRRRLAVFEVESDTPQTSA